MLEVICCSGCHCSVIITVKGFEQSIVSLTTLRKSIIIIIQDVVCEEDFKFDSGFNNEEKPI